MISHFHLPLHPARPPAKAGDLAKSIHGNGKPIEL